MKTTAKPASKAPEQKKTSTSGESRARLAQLDQERAALASQLEMLQGEHARLKAERKQALYQARVEHDATGAERARGAALAIETVEAEADTVADVTELLIAEIEREQARETVLLAQEQQAVIARELDTLDRLSVELHEKIMPVFVSKVEGWAAQVQTVSQLANLPGNRTAESQIGEALHLYFRQVMPTVFRGLVSVPSQTRGFTDWARRCRSRAQRPVAAVAQKQQKAG